MCIKAQQVEKKYVVAGQNKNPPNVVRDLRFLLVISKLAGLFPIYTEVSEEDTEPPSKPSQFYSFVVRTILHVFSAFNFYSLFDDQNVQTMNKNRETDNVNQYMEALISITTYTGAFMLCSIHASKFLKILTELLKIDASIRNHYGARVQNHCGAVDKVIIAVIACQLFIFVIRINMNTLSMVHYVFLASQAFQNFLCSTFVVLVSAFLRMISMRFQFVNVVMNAHAYDLVAVRRQLVRPASFEEDAAYTFGLHNRLLKLYKLTNEACSLMVAFFMGFAFYMITTNAYNIFVEFTNNRNKSALLLMHCFTWLIINAVLLIIITKSCDRATEMANTTSQILARVYGKSKDYQNIIDKFLTKSIRQEVQFTAYGFFVVDNSTLFKIFSAVTTYLVILIQFKQLEDTKLDELAENSAKE